MSKTNEKYWESENGETIEYGKGHFIRCFDKAGKLQFGNCYFDPKTGEKVYAVKFVLDRKELFSDDQAASYLRGTINDWEEMLENETLSSDD